MEAFTVATKRQLPSSHPVFQLLAPHLGTVIAANALTREMWKKQEGRLKLLQMNYKTFTFRMLSLPDILKERGTDNVNQLPNFYYR